MIDVRVVDTRALPPPEPMEAVLEAVRGLAPGTVVCMRHRRQPFPLYPILERQGLHHRTVTRADGLYEIFIWRADDVEGAAFAKSQ